MCNAATSATALPVKRPDVPELESSLQVQVLRGVARIYGKAFQQVEAKTPCPVPASGPALVAANHTSGLDPLAIQSTCPRPIYWVMTRDYYDRPGLRWFFEWTRMIPIDRLGKDAAAWRVALRRLREGFVIGVFPEGRIETERKLLPFQPGIALLAARAGADIHPVYLDGLQRRQSMIRSFLEPQYPSVAWGEPVRVGRATGRRELAGAAERLQATMEALERQCPALRHRGRSLLK